MQQKNFDSMIFQQTKIPMNLFYLIKQKFITQIVLLEDITSATPNTATGNSWMWRGKPKYNINEK